MPVRVNAKPAQKPELRFSAQGSSDVDYSLGWVGDDTQMSAIKSGFRGHSVVQHPRRKHTVLMVARRPGTQCLEVNWHSGHISGGFRCTPGQHLFGHACFSADGRVLLTTEADIKNGQGLIVLRDTDTWRVLSQFPSGGVGPHELAILPDGKTLVVANGGILTHPKQGRKKLNLSTMRSNLAYIDIACGKILGEFQTPEPKASIRHLAVADDGAVVFASQLQRDVAGHDRIVPLGGVHRPAAAMHLFARPAPVLAGMHDYVGSVAVCSRSRVAGFTSPRGNIAAFWHIDSGDFVGYHLLRDVCGISTSRDQRRFILSSSVGQLRELDAVTAKEQVARRIVTDGVQWDNHLLVVENV